ncbi:MAG: hypothetical protein HUU01_20200 [Saprospiraceae bacterium]|nr:hypothetical protein [Saprospiraceae bacterium]
MKKILLLLALSGILLNAFRKEVVLLEYYANKDFIKRVLCINTKRPEMHCDGKCYLMTKLKAAEEAEKQAKMPMPLRDKHLDIQLFCPVVFQYPAFDFKAIPVLPFSYDGIFHPGFLPALLRPPA